MAEFNNGHTLTDKEFDEQIAEAIRLVNNHAREVRAQQAAKPEEPEKGSRLSALKQKVLSRISGREERVTKKQVIYFDNDNNERYVIRTSDGQEVGTISINKKLENKINLVNNKPVFVIYRGNEVYLEKDVMTGQMKGHNVGGANFRETMRASIEATKQIFELLDQKNYEAIDQYITHSMETLIVSGDLESTQKEKREAYVKVQVLYRNISKIKAAMAGVTEIDERHTEILKQLDVLYRQICQILINVGLYDIGLADTEKITRG